MTKKYQIIIYIISSLILIVLFRGYINIFIIRDSEDMLKTKIEILEIKNQELNNILNNELELKEISNIHEEVIYGKITLRDIYTFNDKVKINIGLENDIEIGDAVISKYGLFGIVDKVYKNTAIVNLITNEDINISVKVNNEYGNYNDESVTNLVSSSEIKIYDKVYTSGLTDIIEGIYLGEVIKINITNLKKELIISPTNTKDITYIGVIK